MKKLILTLSLSLLSISVIAQDRNGPSQQSSRTLAINCGGKMYLAVVSGGFSLIPFLGHPQGAYHDFFYGSNDKLLSRQVSAVGLEDNSAFIASSVNYGFLSPFGDILTIAVSLGSTGWSATKNLVNDNSKELQGEIEFLKSAAAFPITRMNFAPAVLLADEGSEACNQLERMAFEKVSSSQNERSHIKDVGRGVSSRNGAGTETRTK